MVALAAAGALASTGTAYVGARNLLISQAAKARSRHPEIVGRPAPRRRRVLPRRRSGGALAPRDGRRSAPDDLRRLDGDRVRLSQRRGGSRRADRPRACRAERQTDPAEHQGDCRGHLQGLVRTGRRDVRGRAPAGRRGHPDWGQRRHQAERYRRLRAPARRGSATTVRQRRRGRRRHLSRFRCGQSDSAAVAVDRANAGTAAGPRPVGRGAVRRRRAGAAGLIGQRPVQAFGPI